LTKITKLWFTVLPLFYLRTSRVWTPCPSGSRKRKVGRSDSIRSIGFAEDHRFNVRWLKEACRILKSEGTIWVTGTHHIIFSLSFALQTMRFKVINIIQKFEDLRSAEDQAAAS